MANITYSVEQVNYFSLLRLLKNRIGDKPYFGTDDNGNICLKSANAKETKYCKDIPQELYYNQEQFNRNCGVKKTNQKLRWAKEVLNYRNLTDDEIKFSLKIVTSSIPMLKSMREDGTIAIYEGNAKGTKRYSTKCRGQILDFTTNALKRNLKPLFLTLTCDIKNYESIADAWENWGDREFSKVMENLRKHYNCEYVATMESTAKGYPHAHIILFFPPQQFPYLKNFRNKEKIRNGKLYNLIKKSVKSPQFCLENAVGDGVKWYLTKYISKTTTSDIFELANKEGEYSKSERKEVQELLYLKLFNKRKVRMTRKGCKSKNKKEALQEQVSVSDLQSEQTEGANERSERAILNSLCTNSPFNSLKSVYSMSVLNFYYHYGQPPERLNNISKDFSDDFEKKSRCLYSERSFISDFMQFALNPQEHPLNRKFYWNAEEDVYDRMLDNYDLNNDEEYMQAVCYIFDFYCQKILVEGYSYIQILNSLEGLSNKKYQRMIGFGQWDVVCSDDPKEVYKSIEEQAKILDKEGRRQAKLIAWQEEQYHQYLSQKWQKYI